MNTQRAVQSTEVRIPGRWCFTDGSCKENDIFSRQGWYSTREGFDGLMGEEISGLVFLRFMRRWNYYYGQ